MIRTRRALRAQIDALQAQLIDARAATADAQSRAERAEQENRDGLRRAAHALDAAERRARAWLALHRGAAATRDELAAAITGETVAGGSASIGDDILRRVFGPAGRKS